MLECKNLSCGYEKTVLEDVNLSFDGGFTSVVGVNASGKSTLIKTLAGLIKPLGGSVILDNEDIARYSDKDRAKRLSYLSQSCKATPMTVQQLVLKGRYCWHSGIFTPNENDLSVARMAMEQIGIQDIAFKRVDRLSGGQRQKAFLAMMLAKQADMLLLDEPTTFLDIGSQLELLNITKQLTKQGKTVVAVLHDVAHALRFSDRIVLVDNNTVVCADSVQNIYKSKVLEKALNVEIKQTGGYYFI